eukprot:CAMPEP_0175087690 /NCGR_PEP_ID=MMETSP0052_2-20121109/29970_1 /TAXON_ID=51329 ORGANISM="Polytomella parva, Strain SAG 63-3" /NCGR_SAMPLE_ID=MMETSP0052_2 /ASSEMBLY_ACC=CAM_ASM_000194 /LENGTH=106 /DNA_ID=CAMNT_0016360063 /DNA_START=879 /DNA_END=1195 /DNA_ORIENTATION=-
MASRTNSGPRYLRDTRLPSQRFFSLAPKENPFSLLGLMLELPFPTGRVRGKGADEGKELELELEEAEEKGRGGWCRWAEGLDGRSSSPPPLSSPSPESPPPPPPPP